MYFLWGTNWIFIYYLCSPWFSQQRLFPQNIINRFVLVGYYRCSMFSVRCELDLMCLHEYRTWSRQQSPTLRDRNYVSHLFWLRYLDLCIQTQKLRWLENIVDEQMFSWIEQISPASSHKYVWNNEGTQERVNTTAVCGTHWSNPANVHKKTWDMVLQRNEEIRHRVPKKTRRGVRTQKRNENGGKNAREKRQIHKSNWKSFSIFRPINIREVMRWKSIKRSSGKNKSPTFTTNWVSDTNGR
jgi:hypothetical protein